MSEIKITNGGWKHSERETESARLKTKFCKSVHISYDMVMRMCPNVANMHELEDFIYNKLGVMDLVPKQVVKEVKTDVITMSVSEAIAQTKAWLNAKEKASVKKSFIREKLLKAGFSETDIMSIMPESHKAYAKETINLFD